MNNLFLNVLTISVLSSFLILTVIIIRTLFKKLSNLSFVGFNSFKVNDNIFI